MPELRFSIGDYVKDVSREPGGKDSGGQITEIAKGNGTGDEHDFNRYKLDRDGHFHNEKNLVKVTKEESEKISDTKSHPWFKEF